MMEPPTSEVVDLGLYSPALQRGVKADIVDRTNQRSQKRKRDSENERYIRLRLDKMSIHS